MVLVLSETFFIKMSSRSSLLKRSIKKANVTVGKIVKELI